MAPPPKPPLASRDQAHRTALLVKNLLEMARLQSGGVTLRRDWQSIEELVGSAIASLETALANHPLELVLPADLPLLFCDGVLIERVLVNLLENAAKYTPVGTRIGVTARAGEETIEITVWDEGPGLPPATLQRCSTSSREVTRNRVSPVSDSASRSAAPSRRRTAARSPRSTAREVEHGLR